MVGEYIIGFICGVIVYSIYWKFYGSKRKMRKRITRLPDDWTYLATGESGDLELEYAWLRCAKRVFKLFCEKQHDYGAKNIGLGGHHGIAFRIGDKVSRYWELLGLDSDEEIDPACDDETLMDTVMDIADYGIIAMMVENGWWPRFEIRRSFGPVAIALMLRKIYERLTSGEKAEVIELLIASEVADSIDGATLAT